MTPPRRITDTVAPLRPRAHAMRRLGAATVVTLVAGGCTGGSAAHTAVAGPPELEPVPIATADLYQPRPELIRHPAPDVPYDAIMASPVHGDPEFAARVERWVHYWSVDAAEAVPVFLRRMEAFEHRVDSTLRANALPPSLRFLPFIESGYNPAATSVASAAGMWQFMPGTARGLGIEVTGLVDERRDPIASTDAAARFLVELHESFGSWFFALAAYNGGPNRVRRILRREAPGVEPSDSLFWALRGHFPRETREFVPKLVGAVVVAGRPWAYDLEPTGPTPLFSYDDVTVPDATTLDVVARAAEAPLSEIERLNPGFVRGMTPPGRPSAVRVPEGRGPMFAANYAAIPPTERVTFVEHVVEEGDTLSHIAVRYGILVADLHDANPGLRPRFLRIGAMLTVPVAPSVRSGAAAR